MEYRNNRLKFKVKCVLNAYRCPRFLRWEWISSTKEAEMMPVGIATIPIPINEMIEAKILPPAVMGYTSP